MARLIAPARAVIAAVVAVFSLAQATPVRRARAAAPEDTAVCLDEEVRADLDAKRRRRSVKERLVQKTNRQEVVLRGGHYVSDMFEATWMAGGSYAYHLTEDFAVEASAGYTKLVTASGAELERTFKLLEGRQRRALLFATNLVYSPLHAKLQTGDEIIHFDVSVTAGAGVVDSALSSGIAGNAGIGFGFFIGKAMTVHLDLRDYVYRQQLLFEKEVVNDLAATIGVGVMFPFVE